MLLFSLSPSKMYQTLTKDVIGYDAILMTFLVKVARDLNLEINLHV